MNFGEAIECLKEGERIKRDSWVTDKFIWLKETMVIRESWCKDPQLFDIVRNKGINIKDEKTIIGLPTLSVYENQTIRSGWVADCSDILAEDWKII